MKISKKVIAGAVLLLLLMLIGVGLFFWTNGETQSEGGLTFQGVKFRTVGANEAFIGSVGLKRIEGGPYSHRYELKFTPNWDNLVVRNTTKFDRALARVVSRSMSEGLTVQAQELGKTESDISITTSVGDQNSGKYHLLRIVDTKSLVEQLNNRANEELLHYLEQDKDYRLVTSVIIAYDHKASTKMEQLTSLSMTLESEEHGSASIVATGKMDVGAQGKDETRIELSMSDGTIYAYQFSRFCWRKHRSGWKVADILLDQPVPMGDSGACPGGSTPNPTSSVW